MKVFPPIYSLPKIDQFPDHSLFVSIDFGGSTIDVVLWEKLSPLKLLSVQSFERSVLFQDQPEKIDTIFEKLGLPLFFKKLAKIFVTGGRSRFFPKSFSNIPIVKISEIEAIGKGGFFLLHHDPALRPYQLDSKVLVVSMGTGTCMVQFQQKKNTFIRCSHVGGTGVGGGTFLGLAKVLLQESDISKLKKLFQSGDTRKVDLSVFDIIGSGIGLIPPDATASHMAKLVNAKEVNFSQADVAAGIVNLIGQTIGLMAVFAAKASRSSSIILTGKLTTMKKIVDKMMDIAHVYSIPMLVSDDALYGSALGAWDIPLKNASFT